jgi:hypothetical protein
MLRARSARWFAARRSAVMARPAVSSAAHATPTATAKPTV